jgi:hypothetical protein
MFCTYAEGAFGSDAAVKLLLWFANAACVEWQQATASAGLQRYTRALLAQLLLGSLQHRNEHRAAA